jgi:hypothetical protein
MTGIDWEFGIQCREKRTIRSEIFFLPVQSLCFSCATRERWEESIKCGRLHFYDSRGKLNNISNCSSNWSFRVLPPS